MSNNLIDGVTKVALVVLLGGGFIEFMNYGDTQRDITTVKAQKPNVDSIVSAFKEAKITDSTITFSRENFSEILRNYKKINVDGPQSARQMAMVDSVLSIK